VNQVTLVGRSGAKAELAYTQAGKPILGLSLATNERGKGQGEQVTSWHKVVIFGRTAEIVAPLIHKGTELMVMGRLSYREWTDRNGNKQKNTDIVAFMVKVIQAPPRGQPDEQQQPSTLDEDDIPY
jgi:single-strand DNA-binding protein